MKRPRADDDFYDYTLFMGIGNLHAVAEPEPEDDPPGLWLPMDRSGSRMGGWRLTPFRAANPRAQIGFRRPR